MVSAFLAADIPRVDTGNLGAVLDFDLDIDLLNGPHGPVSSFAPTQ